MSPGAVTLSSECTSDAKRLFLQNLFPSGMSRAGHVFTGDAAYADTRTVNQRVKELHFEYVRRSFFPHMPSRYQSFFAAESIEGAKLWIDYFGSGMSKNSALIWEISVDGSYSILDAVWRDRRYSNDSGEYIFSPYEHFCDAINYWSANKTEHPKVEVVISLTDATVTVLRSISIETM